MKSEIKIGNQATAYEIVQVAKNSYYVKVEYGGDAIPIQYGSFSSVKQAQKWIEKHSRESVLYPKVIKRYEV